MTAGEPGTLASAPPVAFIAARQIIAGMIRRVHVPEVRVGELQLPESEAHHLRDVLRLKVDDEVELFDSDGRIARGMIRDLSSRGVAVRVDQVRNAATTRSL